MRLNPKHLLMFDELRNEGVGRAIGGGDYIVNPIAACCACCGHVQRLDKANDLSDLQLHVERVHGQGCTLAKRLRLALSERLVTAAQLDAEGVLEITAPTPTDRADFFARPTISHWLLPWNDRSAGSDIGLWSQIQSQ